MATPTQARAARIAAARGRAGSRRHTRLGLALLTCCCLLVAGAAAQNAQAAGLQKGFWGPTKVNGKSQFPIYHDLGVQIYQTAIPWATVAPTQPADARDPRDPAYEWPADVDYALSQAKLYRMQVLIMLTGAPPWANSGRTAEYAPDHPSDFAAFARAAALRYPSVRQWMVWGEPSRSQNFKPFVVQPFGTPITAAQKLAPQRYARLLDAAYGELKAVRRSNIVIGGNTFVSGEVRPGDWVRAMKLANGRPPRLDYYGHNPFSYRNPNLRRKQSSLGLVDFSDLARFDKELQRVLGRPLRKTIKLFLSEFTIATAPDREFNFYVARPTQARWITSAFRVARAVKNIVALGWIHLYDEAPNGDDPISHGGLITHDGKRKPGYHAFKRGNARAGATLDVR